MAKTQGPLSTAAFAPGDVEDARRAAPAGDLQAFAAARGLTFTGQVRDPRTHAMAPGWEEYTFNTCRGVLGKRPGALFHQLLELPIDPGGESGTMRIRMGGDFHGARLRRKMTFLDFVPVIGDLGIGKGKAQPFPDLTAAVPITTVAVHVPQAALLPSFRVRSAARFPNDFPELTDRGLPGYRISVREDLAGPNLVTTVVRALAPGLAGLTDPFVSVEHSAGTLALKLNGFRLDPAALDAAVARLDVLADGLVAALAVPQPPHRFTDPLPVAATEDRHTDLDRWGATLDSAAAEWGLRREDPVALHRAYPGLPVPGCARGVLSGVLPGGATGRVSFHQHRRGSHTLQAAALFAAKPGAATFPVEGILHSTTGFWVGSTGDLVACWPDRLHHGELSVTETAQGGWQAATALGMVMV